MSAAAFSNSLGVLGVVSLMVVVLIRNGAGWLVQNCLK